MRREDGSNSLDEPVMRIHGGLSTEGRDGTGWMEWILLVRPLDLWALVFSQDMYTITIHKGIEMNCP